MSKSVKYGKTKCHISDCSTMRVTTDKGAEKKSTRKVSTDVKLSIALILQLTPYNFTQSDFPLQSIYTKLEILEAAQKRRKKRLPRRTEKIELAACIMPMKNEKVNLS